MLGEEGWASDWEEGEKGSRGAGSNLFLHLGVGLQAYAVFYVHV